jgi:hypothetical protein
MFYGTEQETLARTLATVMQAVCPPLARAEGTGV